MAEVVETIIGGGDFPVTVTVSGTDYTITTLSGDWATVQTTLEDQPWWGNQALARDVAWALAQLETGFGLNSDPLLWNDGSFSGSYTLDAAPYFAYARTTFTLEGAPALGTLLRGYKDNTSFTGDSVSPTEDGNMMLRDPDSAVWAVVVP